jgi:phosphoribosylformylglycinamidine cyclo-ligase
MRNKIHGMVHCSGGAQTKILHFLPAGRHGVNNLHIVKNNMFEVPPLFRLIQKESKTDWQEMYKVFNMGHRMELYLPEEYAQPVIDIAKSFNVDAQIIGHVEKSESNKLTIESEHGIFKY